MNKRDAEDLLAKAILVFLVVVAMVALVSYGLSTH